MSNEKKIQIYAFADEADSFIDGQIAAMKRNGLQGLEIRNVDGTNVSDISIEKAKEVRKKLEDNGLITWSIGSPIGKIGIEDESFEQHIEKFKHTIEIAHELGAENIRLFSFFVPRDKDPAIFKDKVISRMGRFVDVAEGSNICLCHENEKGIYGENAERCLEIHKAFPTLGGIFDPANFVQSGQDTLEAWDMLHTYVKYMHIKDALADGNVVPAGKGMGNVEAILASYFKQGGYAMTIEPHLAVFKGLTDLEREGEQSKVGGFIYADNNAAFDAACDALKKILP